MTDKTDTRGSRHVWQRQVRCPVCGHTVTVGIPPIQSERQTYSALDPEGGKFICSRKGCGFSFVEGVREPVCAYRGCRKAVDRRRAYNHCTHRGEAFCSPAHRDSAAKDREETALAFMDRRGGWS